MRLARSLAAASSESGQRSIAELEEGREDEFWVDVMGEEEYANAHVCKPDSVWSVNH